MSKPLEVFENEETSKLLDYFVAYKKLMSKVEYLKCISALKQRNPPPGKPTSNEESDLTALKQPNRQ